MARVASYHFSVQIISRAKGRSAVAAAAYRAGARLHDVRRGEVHDFSKRRGVAHQEILLPEGAAPWLGNREQLWNHAEGAEKRKDAQLAREINMALPHELTQSERLELVRTFVREQFIDRGMVADIVLHDPVPEKGDDPRNFHAHVLLTLRQADEHGLRRVKTREWNSDEVLASWHAAWAAHQNRALERAGHRDRVDHRSLAAQRADAQARGDVRAAAVLDRAPEIHIGPRAKAAGRKQAPPSRARAEPTARPANGAWRSSRDRTRRERLVEYPTFDRGSRATWNAEILDRNWRATFARADKLERQAARLRKREMRAQRTAHGAQGRQRQMAERHIRRSRGLLAEIERILAGLLLVRARWQLRHRQLLRLFPGGRAEDRLMGRIRGDDIRL
jgi:hypothetical protein